MRRFALLVLPLAGSLLLASCGQQPPTAVLVPGTAASRVGTLDNDEYMRNASPLGVSQSALTVGDGPSQEQILYINFDGATIKRVANPDDDAAKNESWIPDTVGMGSSVAMPAFNAAPFAPSVKFPTAADAKARIVTLVTDWYAGYNLYVTTTRPAAGKRYTMVVVGGQTTQVIAAPTAGTIGIAPVDCGNSSQIDIAFAFTATLVAQQVPTTDAQREQVLAEIAQTIAHEAGHSFGLKHVNNTSDIMYPAVDPNVQGFLGAAAYSEATGHCPGSGATQDTNGLLLSNLGPAPSGPLLPKPLVSFLTPANNATVPYKFIISIDAKPATSAGGTITKVELVQSAVTQLTWTATPYIGSINATGIPDGTLLRFTAIAYNSLGGKASVSTQMTVSASGTQGATPCLGAPNCFSDQTCTGGFCVDNDPNKCSPACKSTETCDKGTCVPTSSIVDMAGPDPGTAAVGTVCEDSSTCGTNGVCAQAGDKHYCTVACDPANEASCPADYKCTAVGADYFCGPKSSGCALGGSALSLGAGASLAPVALLALAGLLLRRRRRFPSAT